MGGPIIIVGTSPLVVTAPGPGNLYVHWNSDSSCGTDGVCQVTAVQCFSCQDDFYINDVQYPSGPAQALDEPDRTDALVFVSLGYGGSIELGFDGGVPNRPGDDFEVVETTYNFTSCAAYPEYADVYMSQDGWNWHFAKTVCQENPFGDISDAGDFLYISHVKILNNNELTTTLDGFDLDGISVLRVCDFDIVNPPPPPTTAKGLLTSYPNPTTRTSQAVFSTAKTGRTVLEVYDMNGRNVARLFNEVSQADCEYRLDFNGAALPQRHIHLPPDHRQ